MDAADKDHREKLNILEQNFFLEKVLFSQIILLWSIWKIPAEVR